MPLVQTADTMCVWLATCCCRDKAAVRSQLVKEVQRLPQIISPQASQTTTSAGGDPAAWQRTRSFPSATAMEMGLGHVDATLQPAQYQDNPLMKPSPSAPQVTSSIDLGAVWGGMTDNEQNEDSMAGAGAVVLSSRHELGAGAKPPLDPSNTSPPLDAAAPLDGAAPLQTSPSVLDAIVGRTITASDGISPLQEAGVGEDPAFDAATGTEASAVSFAAPPSQSLTKTSPFFGSQAPATGSTLQTAPVLPNSSSHVIAGPPALSSSSVSAASSVKSSNSKQGDKEASAIGTMLKSPRRGLGMLLSGNSGSSSGSGSGSGKALSGSKDPILQSVVEGRSFSHAKDGAHPTSALDRRSVVPGPAPRKDRSLATRSAAPAFVYGSGVAGSGLAGSSRDAAAAAAVSPSAQAMDFKVQERALGRSSGAYRALGTRSLNPHATHAGHARHGSAGAAHDDNDAQGFDFSFTGGPLQGLPPQSPTAHSSMRQNTSNPELQKLDRSSVGPFPPGRTGKLPVLSTRSVTPQIAPRAPDLSKISTGFAAYGGVPVPLQGMSASLAGSSQHRGADLACRSVPVHSAYLGKHSPGSGTVGSTTPSVNSSSLTGSSAQQQQPLHTASSSAVDAGSALTTKASKASTISWYDGPVSEDSGKLDRGSGMEDYRSEEDLADARSWLVSGEAVAAVALTIAGGASVGAGGGIPGDLPPSSVCFL